MRILLVEDNTEISRSVSINLANSGGIVCDCVKYGKKAIEFASKYDYDMILLDLSLPDVSGYEVLITLRGSNIRTPIMIISGNAEQKTRCLDDGADDFVSKPFDYGELFSRIKAISRRNKKVNSITIDGMVIDLDNRIVTINNKKVKLTYTEYLILELLASKKGTILARDVFISHLYPGMPGRQQKIIDVFICKLRDKLKSASGGKEYITTVWGRGHMIRES